MIRDSKDSAIYQIYTGSFQGSGGGGQGGIREMIRCLDYLKELGVGYTWLIPFFKSPQSNDGYDVTDYLSADPMFSTMEDVEELIAQAGKREIGCMFGMVFNYTSTEHAWFKEVLEGDPVYMGYYILQDEEPENPPTNWQSKFGGSAWEYVPHLREWYLYLFGVTQADLSWDNPEVCRELKKVVLLWKERGVGRSRFDIANLISKPPLLEGDYEGGGHRLYIDGPRIHKYLQELIRNAGADIMIAVGEMSSTSLDNCIRRNCPENRELSACFSLHHLKVSYRGGDR